MTNKEHKAMIAVIEYINDMEGKHWEKNGKPAENHIFNHAVTLTRFLTGNVSEKCKWCDNYLYRLVRVHHHTENNIDVT